VRRQLSPRLAGRRVRAVGWDRHPNTRISGLERLAGRRVDAVERRGKFLVCPLDPEEGELELVLHLGMTGSLRLIDTPTEGADPDGGLRHVRVRMHLDDGHSLAFVDPRRFGRASVVAAGRYLPAIPTLARLGPEPLSEAFDPDGFAAALARTRAPVKARLLDQRLVAGIGNIYADEALWRARIHPLSRHVGRRRALALRTAIREVLAAAVEREGTTFSDHRTIDGASGRYGDVLDVYGRHGMACTRCSTTLRRIVVAQRGTTYCPRCQRP